MEHKNNICKVFFKEVLDWYNAISWNNFYNGPCRGSDYKWCYFCWDAGLLFWVGGLKSAWLSWVAGLDGACWLWWLPGLDWVWFSWRFTGLDWACWLVGLDSSWLCCDLGLSCSFWFGSLTVIFDSSAGWSTFMFSYKQIFLVRIIKSNVI